MLRILFRFFILLLILPLAVSAEEQKKPDFSGWADFMVALKQDALAEGISEQTVNLVLSNLEPDPRVIRFDRSQPEFVQTLDQYLSQRINQNRIDAARKNYQIHRQELEKVADVYGVPAKVIVSFWGLESNFGRYMGKYSVVRSLATLTYDPRRSAFFRKELMHALRILDEGHIEPEQFVGGWAGAMGQNQFMPSSFRNFAVDFDGDGRKNIWSSKLDVWASIAQYLTERGWQSGGTWGVEVELPEGFDFSDHKLKKQPRGCRALRYLSEEKSASDWWAEGVTNKSRNQLSETESLALLEPEEGSNKSWLVAANYRVILDYNCANKYALSIGMLSDLVGATAPE